MDLTRVLATLRTQGSDTQEYEAKAAHGGLPESIASTLSAFANTPGGGTLLLGIDEAAGFQITGVYDAVECQQAVVNIARHALRPPISISTEVVSVDAKDVVLVYVPEADRSLKPVRVIRSGQAYLRLYDGDYRLSEREEQILLAQRGHPRDDEQPVTDAGIADLDPAAVASYIARRRGGSQRFAPMSDTEILTRTGVLTDDSHPTRAGLLALGVYPQQYFPGLAVQASLHSRSGHERALDTAYITGSIPAMLEDCMDWARRVTPTAIVSDPASGAVIDRPAYPPIAVRELVANALIHRDLSSASTNQPVVIKIVQDQDLMIASPGGLFGLSVDGLGKSPSSLRNARLTEILQFVEARGERVVERLGSGIPVTQRALREAGMAPASFRDQGVRFTVTLSVATAPDAVPLGPIEQALMTAVGSGPATIAQLADRMGLQYTDAQIRYALAKLVRSGRVVRGALNGRTSVYRLREL